MADADIDAKSIEARVGDLASAMERMRDAQADRDDVVVEMRQAARSRLELLAQDLQPVFHALPEGSDQFEFALTGGEKSRLWIDMTGFVRMGRDRRSYEFVKDTRLGRVVLAETADRADMAKRVTDYVAERLLERERAIEGDWIAMRHYDFDAGRPTQPAAEAPAAKKAGSVFKTLAIFVLGMLAGAAGMIAWALYGTPPSF